MRKITTTEIRPDLHWADIPSAQHGDRKYRLTFALIEHRGEEVWYAFMVRHLGTAMERTIYDHLEPTLKAAIRAAGRSIDDSIADYEAGMVYHRVLPPTI